MAEDINLEELEKKAYQAYMQDGLWDLLIGWLIMGMGWMSIAPLIGLTEAIQKLMLIAVWNFSGAGVHGLLKKRITMNRLGQVKFGPKRQADKKKLMVFLFLMVGLNIIAFLFTLTGGLGDLPIPGLLMPIFLGLTFIALPFGIIAYYTDVNRLYFYGLLLGFSLFIADILYYLIGTPFDGIITFMGLGIPIFIVGIINFIQFIKAHPLEKEEVGDG